MSDRTVTIEVTISNAGLSPDQQQMLADQLKNVTLVLLPGQRSAETVKANKVNGNTE